MTFTCAKTFHFAASHQLDGLPPDHQCARLHGHNYEVAVEMSGELDSNGMVFDYGAMDPFVQFLAVRLDHRHLNDVVSFNPTAEALAQWLHARAREVLAPLPPGVRVAAVRVMETPRSTAEFRP